MVIGEIAGVIGAQTSQALASPHTFLSQKLKQVVLNNGDPFLLQNLLASSARLDSLFEQEKAHLLEMQRDMTKHRFSSLLTKAKKMFSSRDGWTKDHKEQVLERMIIPTFLDSLENQSTEKSKYSTWTITIYQSFKSHASFDCFDFAFLYKIQNTQEFRAKIVLGNAISSFKKPIETGQIINLSRLINVSFILSFFQGKKWQIEQMKSYVLNQIFICEEKGEVIGVLPCFFFYVSRGAK